MVLTIKDKCTILEYLLWGNRTVKEIWNYHIHITTLESDFE